MIDNEKLNLLIERIQLKKRLERLEEELKELSKEREGLENDIKILKEGK